MLSYNKKKIGLLLIVTSMVLLSGCSFLSGDGSFYEQNASENILTQEQASETITDFEVQRNNTSTQFESSASDYEGVNITSSANVTFDLISNSTPNNNSVVLAVSMLNTSNVDVVEKTVNKEEDISYSDKNVSKLNVGDNSVVVNNSFGVKDAYTAQLQKNNMFITVFGDMSGVDNSREVLENIVKKQFEVAE